MQNKDLIIIALLVVIIYLYYQQNNQPILVQLDSQEKERQELQRQVNHYQTLYQKRVEKDTEYSLMLEKKVSDLETALFSLAKQKLKGKKEAQRLITDLENNWKQDKKALTKERQQQAQNLEILQKLAEFHNLVATSSGPSLDRSQVNQAESLVEQITQPEIKQLASWMITDSAFILGHNNLLTKLADQEDKSEELREQVKSLTQKNQDLTEELKLKGEFYQTELKKFTPDHQEQLRKINLLFDEKAKDYETIDFQDLYSFLSQIAERERERAKTVKVDEEKKNKKVVSTPDNTWQTVSYRKKKKK